MPKKKKEIPIIKGLEGIDINKLSKKPTVHKKKRKDVSRNLIYYFIMLLEYRIKPYLSNKEQKQKDSGYYYLNLLKNRVIPYIDNRKEKCQDLPSSPPPLI